MDCGYARERLDLIPPDQPDPDDPEVRAARSHLSDCPQCTEELRSRRELDRSLGIVMRDVPVPPGLRSRLVLALADPVVPSSASPVSGPDSAPEPQWERTRTNRRRWIAASLAAVVALVCGVSWQLLHQGASAPLSLAMVRHYWADQVRRLDQAPALPDFNAHWDPRIQDGRWAGLALPGPPRGADLDGDGRHDAAMYPLRGGACLVVLAPGRIGDPPTSGSALAATKYYEPMAHVAWTIGEQVYVCYVPAGGDALRQLLDDVYQNVG